jgi:hypothetical protein
MVALAALVASCGFATRSDQFECDSAGNCPDGRTCISGWCVSEASAPDATYTPPVQCESGEPCTVTCEEPGSCPGGVDCSHATACSIICSGEGSCSGPIECGSGPCDIECSGPSSCSSTIDCNSACSCDLSCSGGGSCPAEVDCPFTGQCKNGKECDSSGSPTCNRC